MRNPDFYSFVKDNLNADIAKLLLTKKKEKYDFDLNDAVVQIECRKKNELKLKDFISLPEFIFPDLISAEQASHQGVAAYHASLASNKNILDMTAGLGIDSFSFAKNNNQVTACELAPRKAKVLKENANVLNLKNINVIQGDSINYLNNSEDNFDLIFIDPSRRDSASKRVFNLRDCSPDVIANQQLLLSHAPIVLIKASPALDITQTIRDFDNIKKISAIGVKGECKELLIELNLNPGLAKDKMDITLEAVNLDNEGIILNKFTSTFSQSVKSPVNYLKEGNLIQGGFLFQPSAMMMKLGAWGNLCQQFEVQKFSPSSHLFYSEKPAKHFPGRITKIIKEITKKDWDSLKGFPASVVSRNHPLSPDQLRKSLRLKEGDDYFIYATRIGNKPLILLCQSYQAL